MKMKKHFVKIDLTAAVLYALWYRFIQYYILTAVDGNRNAVVSRIQS